MRFVPYSSVYYRKYVNMFLLAESVSAKIKSLICCDWELLLIHTNGEHVKGEVGGMWLLVALLAVSIQQ